MQTLGIFAAPFKPQAVDLAGKLVGLAEAAGLAVRLQNDCAAQLRRPDLASPDDCAVPRSDMLVTLSGDGGVLSAARAAAPFGTPILAVDLGRLGFLSAVRPKDLETAFAALLCGDYSIEERFMLDARLVRANPSIQAVGNEGAAGLNDAVVAKSALARILQLSIYIEGEMVASVRADGLVIATPTGSTAYALSAGGPIVHPEVPLFLLCPICAHSLTQRPLVVGENEHIEVLTEWMGEEVATAESEAMLTIDGQIGFSLRSGDRVRVAKSEQKARLVRLPNDTFYHRLREKMRWG